CGDRCYRLRAVEQAERIKKIDHAPYRAVKTIEPPVYRVLAERSKSRLIRLVSQPPQVFFFGLQCPGVGNMPFSYHRGLISGASQYLCQCHRIWRQVSAVTWQTLVSV